MGTTALVYGRDATLAWQAAVKAKGGMPLVFPSQAGALAGTPAERYPAAVIQQLRLGEPVLWTVGKQYGYYKAGAATGAAVGAKVNTLDTINRATMRANIVAGDAAATAEKVARVFSLGSLALVGAVLLGGYVLLSGRSQGMRSWD